MSEGKERNNGGSTLDTQSLNQTLVINGSDRSKSTHYSFEVSGNLKQVEGTLEGIQCSKNRNDKVSGSRANGTVTGGADGFRFSGNIISFTLSPPEQASILLNGQKTSESELGGGRSSRDQTLVIDGTNQSKSTHYSFEVSGGIDQVEGRLEGIWCTINGNDTVSGSSADGAVSGGADGFRFSGDITSFTLDPPETATLLLNGKEKTERELGHGGGPEGPPPTVKITLPNFPVHPGERVIFDGSGSFAPSGSIQTWAWTIRHKRRPIKKNGHGRKFETRLPAAGPYKISLEVTDNQGRSSTRTTDLHVPNKHSRAIVIVGDRGKVSYEIDLNPAPNSGKPIVKWRGKLEGHTVQPEMGDRIKRPGSVYGDKKWGAKGTVTAGDKDGYRFNLNGEIANVTFTNAGGGSEMAHATVYVDGEEFATGPSGPSEPIAKITGPAGSITPYQAVTFDGTNSYDPDGGSITEYQWKILRGRDQLATGKGETFTYAFPSQGTYYVKLEVVDDEGQRGGTRESFSVQTGSIQISVSAQSTVVEPGESTTVTATATTKNGNPAPDIPINFSINSPKDDSTGTLSSRSATTGKNGEASVTYSAPSELQTWDTVVATAEGRKDTVEIAVYKNIQPT